MCDSKKRCINCLKYGDDHINCLKYEKDHEIYSFNLEEFMCYKCGRWNHTTNECYAKYDVLGKKIQKKSRKKNKNIIKS